MRGYQASCLQDGGDMQYKEREHTTQVLETRLYFNYFTHYSATDTQGSQKF